MIGGRELNISEAPQVGAVMLRANTTPCVNREVIG